MSVTLPQKGELVPENDTYGIIRISNMIGGLHFKTTTQLRNQIPRRKRSFPMGCVIKANATTAATIWLLKQEPGTEFTTDADWEQLIITPSGGTSSEETFIGYYDASNNTPALVGNAANYNSGDFFRVVVAGEQDFGSGAVQLKINDKIQIDPTTENWIILSSDGSIVTIVNSVNGKVGTSIDVVQEALINGKVGTPIS